MGDIVILGTHTLVRLTNFSEGPSFLPPNASIEMLHPPA